MLRDSPPKDYNKRKKQRDEGEKQNGATNIYGHGIRKPQKNNTTGNLSGCHGIHHSWKEWMKLIAPFYVQKERGRKLIPLETMLRMYLIQNWFGLSDEGIEDAIYDSYAMKRFLKIDFSTEQTPDATTLLHFHHLL